jgi:hypothetical protein
MKGKIVCSICEEEVDKHDLMPNRRFGMINGAVIGKYVEVAGHKTCVYNVDTIVVTKNRLRIWTLIGALKDELIKERYWNEKIDKMLTDLELVNTFDLNAIPKD